MKVSDVPKITVNGIELDASLLMQEVQYHPAETKREAMVKAAEALIINEVVKQRATELSLWDGGKPLLPTEEYDVIEMLIQTEGLYPSATEKECYQYYQTNKEKFCTAPLLEVNHILLACPPEDVAERAKALELAESLIGMLQRQEAVFGEIASKHSDCPSARQGGSLGQITQGQTVPEFEKQLFKASVGLVNKPIETRYGVHVASIHRRVEGRQIDFDMVKNSISLYLDEKVKRKNLAQYIQSLLIAANIKGFDFQIENSPLMQ
ncbi:peptidylprolyl isomerase [Salinivibrio sp. ML290]|uniref:peptidylprolyl isomerase n=1 Tax=Salinivibrio sp. ML290 TaxID=1909468 RepID=UPI0009885758|nr:peptidylprolyl isomerase [Salinivibrio sp. ML290]OOE72296.1 hypothetical protein BZG23_15040 [Salinivibrio sp. ML290]